MTVEDDAVGGVSQSVERCGAEESIGEGVAPLVEVEVGGDDGGSAFIALGDEVREVVLVRRCKGSESEVIDDEEGDLGQGVETAIKGIRGSGTDYMRRQKPQNRHFQVAPLCRLWVV